MTDINTRNGWEPHQVNDWVARECVRNFFFFYFFLGLLNFELVLRRSRLKKLFCFLFCNLEDKKVSKNKRKKIFFFLLEIELFFCSSAHTFMYCLFSKLRGTECSEKTEIEFLIYRLSISCKRFL